MKSTKKINKKGSAPTHQTRATCQKAATLARASIHHFHTMPTRTPHGHGMYRPARESKQGLTLRRTDSQPCRRAAAAAACQNTRPAPPAVSILRRAHTYTKSLTSPRLKSYLNAFQLSQTKVVALFIFFFSFQKRACSSTHFCQRLEIIIQTVCVELVETDFCTLVKLPAVVLLRQSASGV